MTPHHPPLPPGAVPFTEVNGAQIAIKPPADIDGYQTILIENNRAGKAFARVLDPDVPISVEGDYIGLAHTGAVGAGIVHLVDVLAELQRRAPRMIQLTLVNMADL